MAQQWAVILPDERLETERLFHHDTLELVGVQAASGPAGVRPDPGDAALIVTSGPAYQVVGLGRISEFKDGADSTTTELRATYTRRAFDDPQPAENLSPAGLEAVAGLDGAGRETGGGDFAGALIHLEPVAFRGLADQLGPAPDRRTWLVSLDLPIEAASQAEAVRLFWSYVMELGPRELPAYVSPSGDELAMQAFVLGEEANLDPEEDDD